MIAHPFVFCMYWFGVPMENMTHNDTLCVTADHLISDAQGLYAGKHHLLDLYGCVHLDSVAQIERIMRAAVDAAGATLLHIHVHHFGPGFGVSGVAVLAESHISVHTWPERGFAAFDIFMCGLANPEAAVQVIQTELKAARVQSYIGRRGDQLQ